MKKILFINGTNNIGGGELSLLSIAKYYDNYCTIVSFDEGDYTKLLKKEKIHSIILNHSKVLLSVKREQGFLGVLFKLKSLLLTIFEIRKLSKKYDIIYCNSQKAILISLLSLIGSNKNTIIHIRDMMDNPNISNFQKTIFKILVNFSKPIIIANSKATKNALINLGIKHKIQVVYNGIQTNHIKHHKNNNNKFIISMFSRISHWKGQKYFIEAINLLKDNPEFENMEFWIIGDAIMGTEEEKYKKYIIELINNYDLSDNIKLFGFIENPIEYMQNIDILVLPSIYPEPFGRVIVEAMLLNKVVIATNMGGAKEIIEHNNSGFLVETNKLEHHLKNYFLILYHNKELYNKLSENGYKTALKYFTEDIMIKNIDNIIKGLK